MNRLKYGDRENIIVAACEGHGIRAISRITGHHTTTVARIYHSLIKELQNDATVSMHCFKCACGKYATHNGWCKFRVMRSKARQDFLKRWGKNLKTVIHL